MESFDQDEVDSLNQAAQTARQRRAEHFRRRKVVSEVYDAILKNDAGTQTVSLPLKLLVSTSNMSYFFNNMQNTTSISQWEKYNYVLSRSFTPPPPPPPKKYCLDHSL